MKKEKNEVENLIKEYAKKNKESQIGDLGRLLLKVVEEKKEDKEKE